MENEFEALDLDTLKELFAREDAALKQALLQGAAWDDMREQRFIVTRLSVLIYKKRGAISRLSPAEVPLRGTG